MRTKIEIDERLLKEAVALTGERNRGKAVSRALDDYVRQKRIEELRAMAGTVELADNWYELRHMEAG